VVLEEELVGLDVDEVLTDGVGVLVVVDD